MTDLAISPITTIAQLEPLEHRIKDGLRSFIDVGNTLVTIREGKGYRLRGYSTFEDYCEKQFGFSDRHGRRLITAAETARKVEAITGAAPASEAVARELATVADKPKQIERVEKELKRQGLTVITATAEKVQKIVQKIAPPPPPPARPASSVRANPGNGRAVTLPSSAKAFVIELPPEPLDLAFVFQVLSDTSKHFKKNPPANAKLASDLARAVRMVQGDLEKKNANGPATASCPECHKPITAGDTFCNHCGAIFD